MPSSLECAAWKVLYYARLYSGNRVHNISQNMTSIRDGYKSSISKMAAAMTGCDKCGTVVCESLAKTVAHAWLKANKVPDNSVPGSGTSSPSSGCATPATSMDAAYKIAYYIDYYGGVNLKGNPAFSVLFSGPNNSELLGIISGYPQAIATIRNGLLCSNHGKCATVACENAAKAAAQSWLKSHPYQASGGTKGAGAQAPRPTGTDSDCYHYGGDWLGGALDGLCTAGKKATKGAEAGVQNPLNQYLPIMLVGMGFLAIMILFKK